MIQKKNVQRDSGIGISGRLVVKVCDVKTGRVLRVHEGKNQITYDGLIGVISLLAQDTLPTPSDLQIAYLAVGTNNTPATKGDVALGNQVFRIPLSSANRQQVGATQQLVVLAQLGNSDANGYDICEAGLLCGNDSLFSRRTFAPEHKTAAFVLQFGWTLTLKAL